LSFNFLDAFCSSRFSLRMALRTRFKLSIRLLLSPLSKLPPLLSLLAWVPVLIVGTCTSMFEAAELLSIDTPSWMVAFLDVTFLALALALAFTLVVIIVLQCSFECWLVGLFSQSVRLD